jgi:hypothetical protein
LSDPVSSLEGDRFLDPAELVGLFEALADESAEVRIAAFEALTRLPLAPSDWLQVASFITGVLDSSDSDAERVAVIDASPWVPVASVRRRVVPFLVPEPAPAMAEDRPPRTAEWFGVEPPGFIDLSPGERAEVEAALAMLDRPPWERLREFLDPHSEVREQAVAVTLLFEEVLRGGREHITSFLDANIIVEDVHALQGRFRPDLAGLSLVYQRVAKELFSEYRSGSPSFDPPARYGAGPGSLFKFVEREALGGPRSFCYLIGWTVSRGGLHGLVPRLATELASEDRDERMAAAYLIADAAGYFAYPNPPLFGGSAAPRRPSVSDSLIEDVASEPAPPTRGPTRNLPPIEAPRSEAEPVPPQPEPRWILAWITDAGRPEHRLERAFRAGAVHEIAVAIGPEQEGALAAIGDESFSEALGPVGDMEQLLVMLIPPPAISPPQTGTIFLPRTGTSRPCTFAVHLPGDLDRFEAQIHVYHRNRMIQLALLRGAVVADPDHAGPDARIELELAVIRPGTADLGEREQFDLAVARTGAHTTGVADEELVLFDNDRIEGVVPTLTEILESIATSEPARRADLADPEVVENLRALAFQGRELDEAIGGPLRDQLGDRTLDRVQVLVESASDFLPIELVYGFPTPSTDAGLCPGWKAALRTGRCESDHEAKGPRRLADSVCPLGFWALSKVIERQVVGAESWAQQGLRGVEFAIRSHPSAERMSLRPPSVTLFAASNRVDEVKQGQIGSVVKTLERIADTATYAETWESWVEAVGRSSPTLLVLLSHTKELQRNAALEIGADQPCLLAQLNGDYVKGSSGDRPVVLLLGCETAVTDFGLQTFVSKFQDLGAALVVGTIASVLGQRAAPVARKIATELASASKRRRPIATGDLLLEIRRKLLAKGELTALCLTAFGDADWQVGGG